MKILIFSFLILCCSSVYSAFYPRSDSLEDELWAQAAAAAPHPPSPEEVATAWVKWYKEVTQINAEIQKQREQQEKAQARSFPSLWDVHKEQQRQAYLHRLYSEHLQARARWQAYVVYMRDVHGIDVTSKKKC